MTIGTAVLLPALRHPVLAAHQIATVDRISNGRLVLGVGAGAGVPATEQELTTVGVPFDQRVGRLYEAVRLWRHIWTDPGAPWEGKHWAFDRSTWSQGRPRPEVRRCGWQAKARRRSNEPAACSTAFQGCCAGTAETVLDWLQGYVDAGARHLVLRVGTPDDAPGQLERLAEVAAALRHRDRRSA